MKHLRQHINIILFKKIFPAIFFTVFYLLCASTNAMSQKIIGLEELLQEFFIGQTVYAQHKNEMQLTTKTAFWKIQGSEITNIPLQLEYGITDRLQVELGVPFVLNHPYADERSNGIGNAEIGVLYNILKDNKPFALSLAMDVCLPTENREKDVERTEATWGPSLIAAKQIGRSQVHVSFGAEISRYGSAFNYNLATVYPFGDWRATFEINGEIEDEKIVYITPGLIWKGLDDFEFGLGIPKSITKGSASLGFIFMITHEFSLTRSDRKDD